jgi:DNA transformation protein
MAASPDFRRFIEDHLSELGPVKTRPMFGGAGLYLNGVMFGLIAGDVLYLKTDEESRPDFEAASMQPFTFQRQGKWVATSYWRAPDELLEDRQMATAWARKALVAAHS